MDQSERPPPDPYLPPSDHRPTAGQGVRRALLDTGAKSQNPTPADHNALMAAPPRSGCGHLARGRADLSKTAISRICAGLSISEGQIMYSANHKGQSQGRQTAQRTADRQCRAGRTGPEHRTSEHRTSKGHQQAVEHTVSGRSNARPKKREPRGSINQNAKHGKKTRCCRNPWRATTTSSASRFWFAPLEYLATMLRALWSVMAAICASVAPSSVSFEAAL